MPSRSKPFATPSPRDSTDSKETSSKEWSPTWKMRWRPAKWGMPLSSEIAKILRKSPFWQNKTLMIISSEASMPTRKEPKRNIKINGKIALQPKDKKNQWDLWGWLSIPEKLSSRSCKKKVITSKTKITLVSAKCMIFIFHSPVSLPKLLSSRDKKQKSKKKRKATYLRWMQIKWSTKYKISGERLTNSL